MSDDAASRVRAALRDVVDPELGVDVIDLGLVYGVRSDGEGVEIDMTLTTPGCPVAESLPQQAEEVARRALPGTPVRVNVVWDPPWTPAAMSDGARAALGLR